MIDLTVGVSPLMFDRGSMALPLMTISFPGGDS
jgi:hypothetical protein